MGGSQTTPPPAPPPTPGGGAHPPAHYVGDLGPPRHIKATRIAYGVPIGGELEYTDRNTLARALVGRREA